MCWYSHIDNILTISFPVWNYRCDASCGGGSVNGGCTWFCFCLTYILLGKVNKRSDVLSWFPLFLQSTVNIQGQNQEMLSAYQHRLTAWGGYWWRGYLPKRRRWENGRVKWLGLKLWGEEAGGSEHVETKWAQWVFLKTHCNLLTAQISFTNKQNEFRPCSISACFVPAAAPYN